MLFELHLLNEFLRIHARPNATIPADVDRIFAALDAALSVDHGDAAERLAAAIAAGDAEAAASASRELATPIVVDAGPLEAIANEAVRGSLLASDLYAQLVHGYNAAAKALTEAVKLAPPSQPAPVLASQKVREAYASTPKLLDDVVRLGNACAEYIKQIVGVSPDNLSAWDGTRLSVYVTDEQAKRRNLHAIWTNPRLRSTHEKVMALVTAGGTLEAPATPEYRAWDIPPLAPDGTDPLDCTPEEWARATGTRPSWIIGSGA